MREQGMSVNLITYNAAITALSKASRLRAKNPAKFSSEGMHSEGLWTRALLLLGQMKKDGIDPDGFCYSSAISCCGAEGRWEEALKLIDVMKQGGPRTRPNKISYTAAISKFYVGTRTLKCRRCHQTKVLCSTILTGACGRAGKGDQALELFQSMKEDGLSADRVAYNTLFSALRVAGVADKVSS
jgi:pentatricopeptide repeat protein